MAIKKRYIFLILVAVLVVGLVIAGQIATRIPSGSVLTLTIAGQVAEEDWPDLSARMFEGDVTVFRTLLEALDRAQHDDRIAGVSLEVQNVGMNFGKVQELRDKLQALVASGKFCTTYLETGYNLSYYLATACPEIYLTPTSLLGLNALMGHTTFIRGTLDKLNIYPDFYHIAEYKTFSNMYTEKRFTPAHREMVTDLITGWQRQLVDGIAAGRGLDAAAVVQLVRGGPYLAREAVENNLIDKLLYYDQYRDLLKEKAGSSELNTVSVENYLQRTTPRSGPKVAIVYATGTIVSGKSSYSPLLGRTMGSDTVAGALRQARKDGSVKAIVLRVDSGGGSAIASEIIRREVELAKETKPVVVSMSDVAASGGYMIAMSAHKVVADPGTVTGSIGVVFGKLNLKGFYEMLGMTKDYVALAPNATFLYAFENFTPAQRRVVRKFMRDTYDSFLQRVSAGRGMSVEEVDRIAKGRVWLGTQAKEHGLVDELGGLERAVALAKELANIPEEQPVQYVIFPRPKTTWEQLQSWLGLSGGAVPARRAWLDPERLLLNREPGLLIMPFRIEPR